MPNCAPWCTELSQARTASSVQVSLFALVWVEYFAGALLGRLAHVTLSHPLLIPAALLPFVLLGRPRQG
jgi:cation transporter-like permease